MSKKHALLMAACCLIPIGLIIMISTLAIPTSGLTSIVIALICPVMMLLMMRGMHGGHEEHHEQHAPAPVEQKRIGSGLDQ
jgi:energy-converting hydrogenase Eha subunit F